MYPEELQYSKDHEWIKVDGEEGAVGITFYAQEALGDIVFVELPSVGDHFDSGDAVGSIESVKAVSDVYSPLGGEVTEVNESLEDSPETINSDPYGEGWIFKVKIESESELDDLMDAEEYQEFLKEIEE